MSRRVRAAVAGILVLAFLLTGGAYWQSGRSVNGIARQQQALSRQQQALARLLAELARQQHAQCKFNADLGTAPIITQKGLKAAPLAVSIVSDARIAWHGDHCPGHLHAAAPSFIRWAKRYHVPYK